MVANNFWDTATSANCNVIYRACRVTFAPILISFSRKVVSVQCFTSRGNAKRRKKFARSYTIVGLCRADQSQK